MIRRLIILLLIVGCERVLESIKEGCTASTACNYDATATKDNGSCLENDCAEACGGDLVWDCEGICGGSSLLDKCGICDNDTENDCVQDCAGTWGGDAELDGCIVCGGDNSICSDCMHELNVETCLELEDLAQHYLNNSNIFFLGWIEWYNISICLSFNNCP